MATLVISSPPCYDHFFGPAKRPYASLKKKPVNAVTHQFALLCSVIPSEEDGDQPQDDLQQLEMWQSKWQMIFNRLKCKTICISTKKVPHEGNTFFVESNWNSQVECIPYLGVLLNEDLKWSKYVTSVCRKARKVLGRIKRNLWNCPKTIRQLPTQPQFLQSLNISVPLGIHTFKRTLLCL